MLTAEIFKEHMLLTERKLSKDFSILKIFIATNIQELGSRLHSFTAKSLIYTFIDFFPSLFVLFIL